VFYFVVLLSLVTKWSTRGTCLYVVFSIKSRWFCSRSFNPGCFFSREACPYRGCHFVHLRATRQTFNSWCRQAHIEQQRLTQRHDTAHPTGYISRCSLSKAIDTPPYLPDEIQLVPDVIDSHPTDSRDVSLVSLRTHMASCSWYKVCNNCLSVCLSVCLFVCLSVSNFTFKLPIGS